MIYGPWLFPLRETKKIKIGKPKRDRRKQAAARRHNKRSR